MCVPHVMAYGPMNTQFIILQQKEECNDGPCLYIGTLIVSQASVTLIAASVSCPYVAYLYIIIYVTDSRKLVTVL